jgi:hypothetical protein
MLVPNDSDFEINWQGGEGDPSSDAQRATIYDLISEGEIEGLVDGASSIYLDGTPIMDESDRAIYDGYSGNDADISGSTVTINDLPSGVDLRDLSFTSTRKIVFYDNVTSGSSLNTDTGDFNVVAPSVFNRDSGVFTSADIQKSITFIQAGPNNENHDAKITWAWGTSACVYTPAIPGSWGAPQNVTFRMVGAGGTTSSQEYTILSAPAINQLTLTSSPGGSQNGARWSILPAENRPSVSQDETRNFNSASWFFLPGKRDQEVPPQEAGLTGSSFGSDFNEEIKQTDRPNGTYTVTGQDAILKTASTELQLANPSGTDQIKIVMAFPQMVEYTDAGNKWATGVEFQIYFEYLRGGIWFNGPDGKPPTDTSAIPIFGDSDDGIQARPYNDVRDLDDDTVADLTEGKVTKWALNGVPGGTTQTGRLFYKSESEFTVDWGFSVEAFKPFSDWRIRIKRVTGNEVSTDEDHEGRHQSYLTSIFAITNDVLNYPYSADAGIQVDSDDFSSIPSRAYLARGLKVQVPTNYITREESSTGVAKYTRNVSSGADTGSDQFWDGKFR